MDYESLMDLMRARRTTRGYKTDPIPEEYINQVIEAARWAPTGANTQPFEFVVVKDEKSKAEIKRIHDETFWKVKVVSEGASGSSMKYLEVAPLLIIVLGDPRFKDAYPKGDVRDEIFHAGLSAAVQNMHLAATALGLGGSVWYTVGPVAGMKIKDLLKIPQVFIVKTIMPLGYAKAKPKPPMKRETFTHLDRYDMDKFRREEEIQKVIESTAIFKGKLSHKRKI
ncbi:nitroreductase family protein [Thermodesulfobacteriota bacterium]